MEWIEIVSVDIARKLIVSPHEVETLERPVMHSHAGAWER
jgi:hypothetical protein